MADCAPLANATGSNERRRAFPVGAGVTPVELEDNPYAVFQKLRASEPVSWIACLNMWYVTRYDDVRQILLDADCFTTGFERSTIRDTFGEQMLSTEGAQHQRYRRAVQADFSGPRIRAALEARLVSLVAKLLDGIHRLGTAELRTTFAARLPIQAILCLCGLPMEAEQRFRGWYNSFERALANFAGDVRVRQEASVAVEEFHAFLQSAINVQSDASAPSLLRALVDAAGTDRLTDEEIKRNLSIIFFGGISTVEALILNCLWALHENPDVLQAVKLDPSCTMDVVEETIRWRSPVQSATRHATRSLRLRGVAIEAGDVVNCMLGAANHDPEVFNSPGRFVMRRENIRKHLGFAMGPHSCLGFHLAKLEARIAVEALLDRLPGFCVVENASEPPSGYEFHQPRRLQAAWTI